MDVTAVVNEFTGEELFRGTQQECARFANCSVPTVKACKQKNIATASGLMFETVSTHYSENYRKWFTAEWDSARYCVKRKLGR